MKKPFYKKWWVWVIAVVVIFLAIGANGSKKKENEKTSTPTTKEVSKNDISKKEASISEEKPTTKTTETITTENQETNNKQAAKNDIKDKATVIADNLFSTSIKKIEVNEHAGTDDPDDYVLLLHLSFDAKNTKKTTREVINDHNNTIGAKVQKELENVKEVAVFWEVPYIQKGDNIVKANLERSGDKIMFKENWIAPILQ
ncbi:hypothetical protein COE56_03235 [Bacillus anthracis]|nr:hypothetical protein COE56_03235 [Bacillus anthracis]